VQAEIPGFAADRRLTIIESELPAGVASPLPVRTVTLGSAAPNPFSVRTALTLDLPRAETVFAGIHDVTGRRVRTLLHGTLAPGRHRLRWDGRVDHGRPVPSGIYFCRIETRDRSLEERVVRLR
jgi:flagellar hook assembly protein FlgD